MSSVTNSVQRLHVSRVESPSIASSSSLPAPSITSSVVVEPLEFAFPVIDEAKWRLFELGSSMSITGSIVGQTERSSDTAQPARPRYPLSTPAVAFRTISNLRDLFQGIRYPGLAAGPPPPYSSLGIQRPHWTTDLPAYSSPPTVISQIPNTRPLSAGFIDHWRLLPQNPSNSLIVRLMDTPAVRREMERIQLEYNYDPVTGSHTWVWQRPDQGGDGDNAGAGTENGRSSASGPGGQCRLM